MRPKDPQEGARLGGGSWVVDLGSGGCEYRGHHASEMASSHYDQVLVEAGWPLLPDRCDQTVPRSERTKQRGVVQGGVKLFGPR